jgi:thiamine kinase-like enzyme
VVRRAGAIHVRYAQDLEQALPVFLQIGQGYTTAAPALDQHCVISHGDLDQKNVLWDDSGKPLVIDWESARPLNPTYELLQTGLEWSGITRQFDPTMFEAFLGEYQQAGGVIEYRFVEPDLHALLGDWLIWLMYVVDRSASASNPVKRKRGADQFDLVFQTLLRLQKQLPALLAMAVLNPGVSTT